MDPFAQFGLAPLSDTAHFADPVPAGLAGTVAPMSARALSPDSPMLWVGVLLAATLGLVGFSTHAHVGPGRVSVALGKD